jgi:hypothetical protein
VGSGGICNRKTTGRQTRRSAAYPIFAKSGRGREKDGFHSAAVKNLLNLDEFSSIM